MAKELHDLDMELHHETDKAILASDDGEKDNAVWLPKSQIMYKLKKGKEDLGIIEVTLPIWLAKDKGLI